MEANDFAQLVKKRMVRDFGESREEIYGSIPGKDARCLVPDLADAGEGSSNCLGVS